MTISAPYVKRIYHLQLCRQWVQRAIDYVGRTWASCKYSFKFQIALNIKGFRSETQEYHSYWEASIAGWKMA